MQSPPHSRPIAIWLLICCAMIFVMALLGAITRLTESGLSITEWNPVTGALPPLNESEWNKAFAEYKTIPQYQILNRGMSLDEFKGIFFWEWLHRLWGRLIGIAFALPLIYFAVRGKIDKPLAKKLLVIFALGAAQGFIGWFMVQSGLSARTSVSPYRLALHLDFALAIYAWMLWIALGLLGTAQRTVSKNLARHGRLALLLVAVTITWGAFTAGLRAGEAYNTWPLMEGEFLPAASWTILPLWHNFFENLALVQFIHRWLGPTTAAVILAWVVRLYSVKIQKNAKHLGLKPETLEALERKHGQELDNFWRETFGYGLASLTEAEAGNLLRGPSVDAIRTRLADAAEKARGKGISAVAIENGEGKKRLIVAPHVWETALAGMAITQVALGLSTLLTHVNIVLATLHQAGAITLLTLLLINLRRVRTLA